MKDNTFIHYIVYKYYMVSFFYFKFCTSRLGPKQKLLYMCAPLTHYIQIENTGTGSFHTTHVKHNKPLLAICHGILISLGVCAFADSVIFDRSSRVLCQLALVGPSQTLGFILRYHGVLILEQRCGFHVGRGFITW